MFSLLSTHNFLLKPLIVNLRAEWKGSLLFTWLKLQFRRDKRVSEEKMSSLEKAFLSRRPVLPPMVIPFPEDESGSPRVIVTCYNMNRHDRDVFWQYMYIYDIYSSQTIEGCSFTSVSPCRVVLTRLQSLALATLTPLSRHLFAPELIDIKVSHHPTSVVFEDKKSTMNFAAFDDSRTSWRIWCCAEDVLFDEIKEYQTIWNGMEGSFNFDQ